MATPSILDGYEAAVTALGASGRTISASAVPAKTQTLVDSLEKRSALAGALLLHADGSYHTVPHSAPWTANRMRTSSSGATAGCATFAVEDLSAEFQGAWLAMLSPPAGVTPPARYVRPSVGPPAQRFEVEVVQDEPLTRAVMIVSGVGRLEPRPLQQIIDASLVKYEPWSSADPTATGLQLAG